MGSIFGGSKPKTPDAPKESRMPLSTDQSVQTRRLLNIMGMKDRKGFGSTILTDALRGSTGLVHGGSSYKVPPSATTVGGDRYPSPKTKKKTDNKLEPYDWGSEPYMR